MADDDADELAVPLGSGETVEGAPLARVSARLMWGIEKSEIEEREGETIIRTPDGPRNLGEILDSVDQPYFGTRQEFEAAVTDVIGTGPIPTVGSDSAEGADETEAPAEEDAEGATEAESDDQEST